MALFVGRLLPGDLTCKGFATCHIFIEFVTKRSDRDAENLGGVGPVAKAVIKRIHDQLLLDLANRFAH